MVSTSIQEASALMQQSRPEIRPGYTVRVHERIQEGGKERIQVFEGLVIALHKGKTPADSTFTVRRIASGVGVERVFSLHSPKIENIDVKKVARVRRAKLFFLRGRRGKAARLSERFTTAAEFSDIVPDHIQKAEEEARKEAEAAAAAEAAEKAAAEKEVTKQQQQETSESEEKENSGEQDSSQNGEIVTEQSEDVSGDDSSQDEESNDKKEV